MPSRQLDARRKGKHSERIETHVSEASATLPRLPKFYVAAILGDKRAREVVRRRSSGKPFWPIPRDLTGDVGVLRAWMQMRNRIRQIGDESHGFAPEPVPPGQFDLHVGIMSHGTDAFGALKRFIGASNLLRPDLDISTHLKRNHLEVSVKMREDGDAVQQIYHEIYAVVIHCALRWLTGENVQLSHIRAAPAPAGAAATFVSTLGRPIRREGVGVTLYYMASDARAPLLPVKLGRWGSVVVDQFVRELKLTLTAKPSAAPLTPMTGRIEKMLAAGHLSESVAAARLGLSVATLRRRLTEEGVSFRELATQARRLQAEAMLQTDRPFADVAAELGFSDERSFRRACKDWFGMPPVLYRRYLQGE